MLTSDIQGRVEKGVSANRTGNMSEEKPVSEALCLPSLEVGLDTSRDRKPW